MMNHGKTPRLSLPWRHPLAALLDRPAAVAAAGKDQAVKIRTATAGGLDYSEDGGSTFKPPER